MKWSHVPGLMLFAVSACSLLSDPERHFGSSAEAGAAGDDAQAGAAGDDSRGGAAGDESAGGAAGDESQGGAPEPSGGTASGGAATCSVMACAPGQVDTGTEGCGACNTGKHTHTRTCGSDACSWGAWSAWSTCSGATAACTPGQTTTCTNGDPCGQRVCSNSCTWSACQPKTATGCLRIREGHTDAGSNYKCCGAASHKWVFCASNCQWGSTCETCSKGSPDYCTECY